MTDFNEREDQVAEAVGLSDENPDTKQAIDDEHRSIINDDPDGLDEPDDEMGTDLDDDDDVPWDNDGVDDFYGEEDD